MTEQVVDIRDRIEKMRTQMSGPDNSRKPVVSNKGPASVEKLDVSKINISELSEKKDSESKKTNGPELKQKKNNENVGRSDVPQEEEKEKIEYESPQKTYKDYQNQNTFDKEKKSVKFDEVDQPFPQFSLNVSNPISWKLMLLIMLMQLLTNIMLVVVLYLK